MQPVLYALHMIGLAGILVGWVLYLNASTVGRPIMVWAARLQLLVGLGLLGVLESQGAAVNHVWVAVKLVVAIGVVACCEMGNARIRKGGQGRPLLTAAFALTLLNAAVAWLWHA